MRTDRVARRIGILVAVAAGATFCATACRRGDESGLSAGAPAAEAARATSRKAAELKRAFEEKAAGARDDLDAARRLAEAFLSSPVAPGGRQAERARTQALRALERGQDVLARAAEDGSRTAEAWARVIQDRMMRLEETLKRLTGDTGHADS